GAATGDGRLLVLDPQAAGALLRGCLRLCHRGGGERRTASLDVAVILRVGRVPSLCRADAGCTLRCGIRSGTYQAPGGGGRSSQTARSMGGELPREFREPRRVGGR